MAGYENEQMFFKKSKGTGYSHCKDLNQIKKIESGLSKKLNEYEYIRCLSLVLKNSIYCSENDEQFYYLMDKFIEHTISYADKQYDNTRDNTNDDNEILGDSFSAVMLREKQVKNQIKRKEKENQRKYIPIDSKFQHPILHEIAHQLPKTFNKLKYCVNNNYLKLLFETDLYSDTYGMNFKQRLSISINGCNITEEIKDWISDNIDVKPFPLKYGEYGCIIHPTREQYTVDHRFRNIKQPPNEVRLF